jgi:hypothetical protein
VTACGAATWNGYPASTEPRSSVPAIRQLAQQRLAEQQARIATLRSWRRAGSKAHARRLSLDPLSFGCWGGLVVTGRGGSC